MNDERLMMNDFWFVLFINYCNVTIARKKVNTIIIHYSLLIIN